MSDAWLKGTDEQRLGLWHRVRIYFGLADDPRGDAGSVDQVSDDRVSEARVLEALAALERRVTENTAAVEALRAELKRDRG